MALLIYTLNFNNRKSYVFEHIFKNILGISYEITDDLNFYKNYNGAKISYDHHLNNALSFIAHPFINEKEIKKQVFAFADYNELKLPFPVENSVFSFDVFAASFYFLSRYEEYIIKERDQHQRFEGKNSLAFQNGFITRPLIDEWAFAIADKIKKQYPNFEIRARKFQFIPTLDIDRPYYYQTDSFLKSTIKRAKLFFKGQFQGLQKDPLDVYEMVKSWDKKYQLKTLYFILVGSKHVFDVAPSIINKTFQKAIKEIAGNQQIGIHPSYFSNLNALEIQHEKQELEIIASQKININRQHYLLLNLPKTYRDLISAGINEDYTLAFADVAGFRALTCTPFFWYDLEKEEITSLLINPTTVMDQTLKKYMNLSPIEALQKISELIKNVKNVNGTFISLWHNESINDFGTWKGWKRVYLAMIEKAMESQQP
jgi:hypothetical protein